MAKRNTASKEIELLGYRIPVTTFIGGLLTLLYLFITTAASGFLAGIAAIAIVAFFTSLYSLIRNKPSWAQIPNRKIAGLVLAGSFLLAFISGGAGAASSPDKSEPVIVQTETTTPSPTNSKTSPNKNTPTQTPTSSPSPTPTPTAAPVVEAPPVQAPVEQPVQAPAEPVFTYENCTAVRAAGAAPIYVGDYGYSRKLDRDGDGVACE